MYSGYVRTMTIVGAGIAACATTTGLAGKGFSDVVAAANATPADSVITAIVARAIALESIAVVFMMSPLTVAATQMECRRRRHLAARLRQPQTEFSRTCGDRQ